MEDKKKPNKKRAWYVAVFCDSIVSSELERGGCHSCAVFNHHSIKM